MAHSHSVYDTDTHFIINPVTRAIKNDSSKKTILMQRDHNSERFTFELPRYVEGHDMSLCNQVEVHYLNVGKGEQNSGLYTVDDFAIGEDENTVVCSWLISKNATQLKGQLTFLLNFRCLEDGFENYSWHTDIYKNIYVSEGIDAALEYTTEYVDVIEQWKAEVMATLTEDISQWEANTKVSLEESIDNKFNEHSSEWNTALAVERARIDQFKKLAEGSTTGDAELQDIRIGADNVTYDSAGAAVRGQLTKQNAIIFDVADNTGTFVSDFEEVTSNYTLSKEIIRYSDGLIMTPATIGEATDYLPVDEMTTLYVSAKADNFVCTIAFYDADKKFIKSDGRNSTWLMKKINLAYIRSCCPEAVYYRLTSYTKHLHIYSPINELLHNKIKEIESLLKAPKQYEDITANYSINEGVYINKSDGSSIAISDTTYCATGFIELTEDTVFAVSGTVKYSAAIVAFYDANQNFIKSYGCNSSTSSNDDTYGERVTFNRELITTDIAENICGNTVSYVKFGTIDGKLLIEKAIMENIQSMVGANTHLPWVEKTWVVFGDSLTEENGTAQKRYHDNIHDETGITVLNHGKSGSGYVKSGAGAAWHSRVGDLEDVEFDVITFFGSGNDLSSNIDIGTASDTGTETIGGAINTTLDNLLAIHPLAKIGMITPTPWYNNMPYNERKMTSYSDLIIEIAKRRSIPYLDLFRCSTLNPNESNSLKAFFYNSDGTHPNDEGHKRITPQIREFLKTLI